VALLPRVANSDCFDPLSTSQDGFLSFSPAAYTKRKTPPAAAANKTHTCMPQGATPPTLVWKFQRRRLSACFYIPYLCVANVSSLFRIRCHISIHAAAKVSNQPTNDRSKRLSTACAKFQLCELCFIDDGPTRKFYLSWLLYLYGRRVRNWLLPLENRQWHIVWYVQCFWKASLDSDARCYESPNGAVAGFFRSKENFKASGTFHGNLFTGT